MESRLKDSGPSSPFPCLDEEEMSEHLNEACLLSDSDLSFDDRGSSLESSNVVIPETPERPDIENDLTTLHPPAMGNIQCPLVFRRKRQSQVTDHCNGAAICEPDAKRSERKDVIPGYCQTTPSSHRTLKRRRLQDHVGHVIHGQTRNRTGFVPASSLLSDSDFKCLESPHPSQSSSSFSSTGSVSCSAGAPEHSVLGATAAPEIFSSKTSPHGHYVKEQKILNKFNKDKRLKRSSTRISHGSSRCTSTAPSLAAEETNLQCTDMERRGGCAEDIVVIDEDDDVVVEATVRSIQMAEDEAFARSLQEQFDREEQFHQEQNRLHTTSLNRQPQNLPFDSYVGLSWISPWSSMMQTAAFSELQQPSRQTRPRGGRNSRRRNGLHVPLNLLDDSQGNNYEALLAFEESQGAVMSKNTLSKEEIERLPTKAYDPLHNAGKTDCQICFSDYKKGEKLRMLPCFHDYHVKCIDRWLKENATCPICRADVSL